MKKIKVAFLDRDGALIFEPPDTQQVNGVEQLQILPGVVEGLQGLQGKGFKLVMVTNQDGLGTPSNPANNFETVQEELFDRLYLKEIEFYRVFVCPHLPSDSCQCRKPKLGMVIDFLVAEEGIDREKSLMIGDRETDRQFAKNLGVKFYRMETNGRFPKIG